MAKDMAEKATESALLSPETDAPQAAKKPEKAKKPEGKSKDPKKVNFFKRIARFFKDVRSEWKKIVWPSKKQVLNNTLVVVVVMAVVAVVVWLLDFLFIGGFNLLWGM